MDTGVVNSVVSPVTKTKTQDEAKGKVDSSNRARRALMIAYHYPPVQISSGVQRTLAFSRDLPEHGWEPLILTVHPRAYAQTSEGQLQDIPADTVVQRAWALDTNQHLSIGGRYLELMALPDRWVSWWLGGVVSGLKMIREYQPSVIFSTYPIATAHLIALTLHRLTGIPWVADFRDSMTEADYPREGRRRRVFQWIERKAVHACSKAIFTTAGAVKMYKTRYPDIPETRWMMIPNGYNEVIFSEVEASLQAQQPAVASAARVPDGQQGSPYRLVHSGVLYPSERDPRAFFAALSALKQRQEISARRVQIVLRATGHDELYAPMLQELDIEDLVLLEAGVDYRQALEEMLNIDGLLIFQASNCNHQIPAKLYEYFRCRKPILALTDRQGDTARTLLDAGMQDIVPLDNQPAIEAGLMQFLKKLDDGSENRPDESVIFQYSRQEGAAVLAQSFNELLSVPLSLKPEHQT